MRVELCIYVFYVMTSLPTTTEPEYTGLYLECVDFHIAMYNAKKRSGGEIINSNKKVLLRERKRHTARRVASTPYVVLTGYPPRAGYPRAGYPPSQGTPPARVPPRPGYPPGQGTPLARVPPPARVPPLPGPGRVPPPGCPMAFWEMLQSIMGYGYPPLWTN